MTQPNTLPSELTLTVKPLGDGYATLVDSFFTSAITASEAGGDATQAYFDALNQTADFWTFVAETPNAFSPGTDPEGRPVIMASSGNVDMRAGVVASSDPTLAGVLAINTRNTTTSVSQTIIFGLTTDATLGADGLALLTPAIYESVEAVIGGLAQALADSARVEGADIDPSTVTAKVLADVSSMAIRAAGNTLLHIDWLAVTWSAEIVAKLAGLSVLVAIPLIIEFAGHAMSHSLVIQNLTDAQLTCSTTLLHGSFAVQPSSSLVPAETAQLDPLDPSQTALVAFAQSLQTASSEFGRIGFVTDIAAGNGDTAQLVVSIPWAGGNTIWAGPSAGSADAAWSAHADPPSTTTSTSATFGAYTITLSINQLSGKVYGAYFYCSTAVIAPA
ncbi:hypothetical protein ACLESD_03580 [Pyxidicoccus sp. 3LFB2]